MPCCSRSERPRLREQRSAIDAAASNTECACEWCRGLRPGVALEHHGARRARRFRRRSPRSRSWALVCRYWPAMLMRCSEKMALMADSTPGWLRWMCSRRCLPGCSGSDTSGKLTALSVEPLLLYLMQLAPPLRVPMFCCASSVLPPMCGRQDHVVQAAQRRDELVGGALRLLREDVDRGAGQVFASRSASTSASMSTTRAARRR